MDTSKLEDMQNLVGFVRTIDLQLVSLTPERIVGELPITAALTNHMPNVHGGAIMTLGDALGAFGAWLNMPEGAEATTTIESKTNFLRPAMEGDTLTGICTPLSVGRRLSVWQTEITRADGKRVAMVTQTQIYL